MKNKLKYYVLTFLIPIVIFFIVATISNHAPLGKYYFNMFDGFNMYPSLLVHSMRSIKEGSLFYTFLAGLGTDYYNIHTLYMNSPLNYLFLLFKEKDVFNFFTFLIFLRIGLSSLTMFIYLDKLEKDKYYKKIIFSLCYSLSTFSVAYSMHIMWMDSFVLLPLIILGLEKLILEKKSFLYILFLSMALIINFYIGYMICIFCLLYFIYKSYVDKKINKDNVIRFITSSLLCGLIAGVVLVPQIISLFSGRGNEFNVSSLVGISRFSLRSYVYSFYPGAFFITDNYNDGSIVLYSSLLVLVLNILLYFNNNITKRMKVATLIFSVFIFLSSFVKVIDYAWNLFQPPVWWSHRYAFVFVFFFISIAYRNTINSNWNLSSKKRVCIFVILFILSLISFSLKGMGLFAHNKKVYVFFIAVLISIMYIYFIGNKKMKYVIIILFFLEIGYNAYDVMCCNYYKNLDNGKEYLDNSKYIDMIDDKDFYRVKNVSSQLDDGLMFNYNAVSLFSSSYNNRTLELLKNKLNAFNGNVNTLNIQINNPALLSLFGVKYIISNSEYYEQIDDRVNINEKALPLGFVVTNFNEELLLDGEYFKNIEKIYKDLSGKSLELFYEQEMNNLELENFTILPDGTLDITNGELTRDDINENNTAKYDFVVSHDGVLLAKNHDTFNFYQIFINGELHTISSKIGNDGIFKVHEGDNVSVLYPIKGYEFFNIGEVSLDDLKVYVLDDDKLNEALDKILTYDRLNNCQKIKNGLTCDIDVKEDGFLFTTIPYYNSYKLMVDNEETDYEDVYGSLVGFKIKSGKHKVTISYGPAGFYVGVITSLVSIVIAIVYIKFQK